MSASALIVVGSVNRDLTAFVPDLPRPGETVSAVRTWVGLGGKGANQAVAAATEGARVWLVGAVGDDEDGRACRDDLVRAGVRADHLHAVPDVATGRALVTVDADGENTIVVVPGANARVRGTRVREACEAVVAENPGARVAVLCQGELPAEAAVAAAALCRDAGHRFVLNVAPVIDLPAETLAQANPLIVNEGELCALLGSPQEPRLAAGRLSERLGTGVVVTLGADGALLADARVGSVVHVPAVPVEDVVNTTGAGDAFVGALAAALLGDEPVESALGRAALAGARAVAQTASSGR